jgi:hypothetical protein
MTEGSIIMVSPAQLAEIVKSAVREEISKLNLNSSNQREIVRGIKGIAETLKCGTTKAQAIKNSGVLNGYIFQVDKVICGYKDDIIKAGRIYAERQQKSTKKPRRIN